MIYTKYIEREEGHIALTEWQDLLENSEHLRPAVSPDPHEWVGYIVNPRSSVGQFHQREERKFDCDLFFEDENAWKRVFYWHFIPGTEQGVVTFEGSSGQAIIDEAALLLAQRLDAKIEDEETTKYD